jgi:hypothetical protein
MGPCKSHNPMWLGTSPLTFLIYICDLPETKNSQSKPIFSGADKNVIIAYPELVHFQNITDDVLVNFNKWFKLTNWHYILIKQTTYNFLLRTRHVLV